MSTSFKIAIDKPNQLFVFDKRQLRKIMRQVGAEVANVARAKMRASSGGRTYGSHTASLPGNAPAPDTKALLRSVKVVPYRSGLGVKVIATALNAKGQPYSRFLEAGVQYQTSPKNRPTRVHRRRQSALKLLAGHTTILPRPFISTSLAERQSSIAQRVAGAVQDGVQFVKVKR